MTASRALSAAAIIVVALECTYVPETLAAAPPQRTDVGEWLAHAPDAGAVAVLPMSIDAESTPAMLQSLEHHRPVVNGYSGQRPDFYAKLVDTVTTFPSAEALIALHDTGVQYLVTPAPIASVPADVRDLLVERARFADGTIYELAWSPAVDARFERLTTVVPPPPGPIPFQIGEVARYAVKWDGGGVNLSAGDITLAVEAPQYRLVATAATAPWVARFYEAHDRFETITDATLLPTVHERDQHDGSRHVTRAFVFDSANRRVLGARTVDAAREPGALVLPLVDASRDPIAALYYVRTLPLEPGSTVQFPVNDAGRNLIVEIHVRGREQITVAGRVVDAIRVDPLIRQRLTPRRPVTGTVWLSADARRVPVKVALSAEFGQLTLELVSYRER